ncbi:hypothetical protein K2X85_06585 [bacterium]|jgi:hypothetical protein|nr:hypothetical protein [bacterium]
MLDESVYNDGIAEALRHKWLESEKAGRDLGLEPVHQWCRQYWQTFLRHRWLEHIKGIRRWKEIDRGDFGLLNYELLDENLLVDRILDRLIVGMENLEIILWAREWNLPMDRVIRILEALDINSRRLDSIIDQGDRLRAFLAPLGN